MKLVSSSIAEGSGVTQLHQSVTGAGPLWIRDISYPEQYTATYELLSRITSAMTIFPINRTVSSDTRTITTTIMAAVAIKPNHEKTKGRSKPRSVAACIR